MNQEAKDQLNHILEKDKNDLTYEDKGFLRARVSYLGKRTREDYKDILKGKLEKPAPVEEPKENVFPPVVEDSAEDTTEEESSESEAPSDDGEDEE